MGPVQVLKQRKRFLENIINIALDQERDELFVRDFKHRLHKKLIDIDNLVFDIYETTKNKDEALRYWEREIEQLRVWISTELKIDIEYV